MQLLVNWALAACSCMTATASAALPLEGASLLALSHCGSANGTGTGNGNGNGNGNRHWHWSCWKRWRLRNWSSVCCLRLVCFGCHLQIGICYRFILSLSIWYLSIRSVDGHGRSLKRTIKIKGDLLDIEGVLCYKMDFYSKFKVIDFRKRYLGNELSIS